MRTWHIIGRVLSPPKVVVFWTLSRFYKTTRPRVAIVQKGRVLLVQNWGNKHWSLPGGGAHRGEALDAAAVREIREELGIVIPSKELVYYATFEQRSYHAPVFVWHVDESAELAIMPHKWEIHDAKWHTLDELPGDSLVAESLKN